MPIIGYGARIVIDQNSDGVVIEKCHPLFPVGRGRLFIKGFHTRNGLSSLKDYIFVSPGPAEGLISRR